MLISSFASYSYLWVWGSVSGKNLQFFNSVQKQETLSLYMFWFIMWNTRYLLSYHWLAVWYCITTLNYTCKRLIFCLICWGCSHQQHDMEMTNPLSIFVTNYGGQERSVVECLPKDSKVCSSSFYHGILLWRWALHLHLAPAAHISIMLLRPAK